MASDDLGLRIRRARERKRWSQKQLAEALGVGIRSVGSWERGEAEPRSAIGALEDVLGVSLNGDQAEVYTDPDEAALWALDRIPEDQRRILIAALRDTRRDRAG